jgi:hypothetical protein
MKKHLIVILVIVSLLTAAGIALAVSDVMTLVCPTKGNVKFMHKLHIGYAANNCGACHHKPPVNGAYQKCDICHTATGQPNGGGFSSKTAFHKQCTDCHKKLNKGPQMNQCNGCHGTA